MPPTDPLVSMLRLRAAPQFAALKGRAVVVGVSGGADSTALLRVLSTLCAELRLTLFPAHLDHGLRPESAADARAVARNVALLGLGIELAHTDVPARIRKDGLSVEAAARECRYAFFAEYARSLQAVVAVGHNEDDQSETVLLNLARGSGISGLAGMRGVAPLPGAADVTLVRPLLDVPANEIRAYCLRNGLPVVEDPSNETDGYRRNLVRHRILPVLREVNSQAVAHIAATAATLREDEATLDQLAERAYGAAAQQVAGAVLLNSGRLLEEPVAIRVRALRLAIRHIAGSTEGITRTHLAFLMDMLASARGGRETQLPHAMRVVTTSDGLLLWRGALPEQLAYSLPLLRNRDQPECGLADGWRWEAREIGAGGCDEAITPGLHEHVRRADGPLRLDAAAPHETFQPLGMSNQKRLGDFLVNAKVPRHVRPRVPLVKHADSVVSVLGHRLDHRWRLESSDTVFTCLRAWQE